MYSLAIYIYMFCVNVVAIFNKKARKAGRSSNVCAGITRNTASC